MALLYVGGLMSNCTAVFASTTLGPPSETRSITLVLGASGAPSLPFHLGPLGVAGAPGPGAGSERRQDPYARAAHRDRGARYMTAQDPACVVGL